MPIRNKSGVKTMKKKQLVWKDVFMVHNSQIPKGKIIEIHFPDLDKDTRTAQYGRDRIPVTINTDNGTYVLLIGKTRLLTEKGVD